MKLSPEEKETIILFNEKYPDGTVYTHNKKMIKTLIKRSKDYPDLYILLKTDGESVEYKIPKEYAIISAPRNLSAFERAKKAARLNIARTSIK